MTTILKDTDLTGATAGTADWRANGWETCAAGAFDVVLYTFNMGAAYSDDNGETFHLIDAAGLCRFWGRTLAGDQVVTYIPSIGQFVWVMLTQDSAGTDAAGNPIVNRNLVLAMASPREIKGSAGTAWVTWLIPSGNFGNNSPGFDRPSVSFGEDFLYIAVNLGPNSIAIRLSLNELEARGTVNFSFFQADNGVFWMRPTQSTGPTAYFAALMYARASNGQDYISNIRVYEWPEDSNTITRFDVGIASVPTEGHIVQTVFGDWLANGRGSLQILGLTRSDNDLWAVWWANRTVPNPPAGVRTLSFPHPHIEIAIIDVGTRQLKKQLFMWNPEIAFVFPDVATNGRGEVGLSFCWGGGQHDPQFGVGLLTWPAHWPTTSLISITSGPSTGAGGDYISIRKWFPGVTQFGAAGFNVPPPIPRFDKPPPGPTNQPHYVLFGP
jgi:hypothetical protein